MEIRERAREWIGDAIYWVRRHLIWPWLDPLRYRLIDRYHIVQTGLEPGYHEIDERMLHAAFSLLVEFVERECASRHKWGLDRGIGQKPFCNARSNGLAFLAWEKALVYEDIDWSGAVPDGERGKPTPQAVKAAEIEALYLWWKDIRPLRLDPHIEAGWVDADWNPLYTEETASDLCAKVSELEEKWHAEDEEMLIRLVKLRRCLWT